MTQSSPLNDKDRSDLIAYLDGELEGEAARAIEARISRDPAVRSEAESLKRTWDLLDYLPRPEPSPNFTHRTLDKLSTHPTRAALGQRRSSRRWLFGAGWAAAVVLIGLAGYFAAVGLTPPPKPVPKDLARDLRLIENFRAYEDVEMLEFLRELDRPDLFGDDGADS
jgi:anti-sigma factor RsiW